MFDLWELIKSSLLVVIGGGIMLVGCIVFFVWYFRDLIAMVNRIKRPRGMFRLSTSLIIAGVLIMCWESFIAGFIIFFIEAVLTVIMILLYRLLLSRY
jgi:CHASE2 domain-containing sensor protein